LSASSKLWQPRPPGGGPRRSAPTATSPALPRQALRPTRVPPGAWMRPWRAETGSGEVFNLGLVMPGRLQFEARRGVFAGGADAADPADEWASRQPLCRDGSGGLLGSAQPSSRLPLQAAGRASWIEGVVGGVGPAVPMASAPLNRGQEGQLAPACQRLIKPGEGPVIATAQGWGQAPSSLQAVPPEAPACHQRSEAVGGGWPGVSAMERSLSRHVPRAAEQAHADLAVLAKGPVNAGHHHPVAVVEPRGGNAPAEAGVRKAAGRSRRK